MSSQQAVEIAERESVLRTQMNDYGEKFKGLQESLTQCNQVFANFKKDTDKLQKRIKSSEKERLVAEKLAQKNGKELAEILEKHEPLKKEAANLKKQKDRMETLCRTLTQERAELKEKLRALGALPDTDKQEPASETGAEAKASKEASTEVAAVPTD